MPKICDYKANLHFMTLERVRTLVLIRYDQELFKSSMDVGEYLLMRRNLPYYCEKGILQYYPGGGTRSNQSDPEIFRPVNRIMEANCNIKIQPSNANMNIW